MLVLDTRYLLPGQVTYSVQCSDVYLQHLLYTIIDSMCWVNICTGRLLLCRESTSNVNLSTHNILSKSPAYDIFLKSISLILRFEFKLKFPILVQEV